MSKFYLKELLIPRVRLLIDSIPFTSEGYSRAKSIGLGKFDLVSQLKSLLPIIISHHQLQDALDITLLRHVSFWRFN